MGIVESVVSGIILMLVSTFVTLKIQKKKNENRSKERVELHLQEINSHMGNQSKWNKKIEKKIVSLQIDNQAIQYALDKESQNGFMKYIKERREQLIQKYKFENQYED